MKNTPPTKNQIARKIMAHFQVCRRTAFNWFSDGCPADFDAAVQWRLQRIADEAVRRPCGPEPRGLIVFDETSQITASGAEELSFDSLSEKYANLVALVVELRLAGLPVRKISKATGLGDIVINRVIDSHPDTRSKDAALAKAGWGEIRRMSCDLLRERLAERDSSDRLKASELALIAGIAQDKLAREASAEITFNIEHKINALSYEELINSIPKPSYEGEFEIIEPVQRVSS